MRSLEAFIEENGQWERAAKRLYCHRHTLALPHPARRGADGAGPRLAPATGSSSGSRCEAGVGRMKVGVPTEIKVDEYRVALTPAGVRELVDAGHEVLVQHGAGLGSAIADEALHRAGREDPARRRRGVRRGEMIVKVKEPQPPRSRCSSRATLLFTYLHLAADVELTRRADATPARPASPTRPSRTAGRLPLLAPMSEVAGKIATQAGAFMLEKPLGGRGILLGGVPGVAAASVVVIGGGVVGMQRRPRSRSACGATVLRPRPQHRPSARARHDLRRPRRHDASRRRSRSRSGCRDADLVIGAVLVPGAKAPQVVTREQLVADEAQRGAGRRLDRPGRLLRDLAGRPRTPTRPTRSTGSCTTASRTCRAPCRSPRPTR